MKNSDLKLATATKLELKAQQDKIMKLETFDLKVIFMELFFCLRFWMVFKICLSINQHFSINQSKRVGGEGVWVNLLKKRNL